MAYWDSFDGKNGLLKKWLDAFRAQEGFVDTDPALAWRPSDGSSVIIDKLVRCYNVAYSSPNTSEFSWRPGDNENIGLRKILDALRLGHPAVSNGPGVEWRPMDSSLDIYKKILRVTCETTAETDPNKNVRDDNEIWCLRKIVEQL